MKKLLKLIYVEGEQAVCFVMFLFMLVILFIQVILRFVFHASNMWSEELSRYLFIYIVFLASSYAVTQRKHIKIDAFESIWPKVLRGPTAIIGEILWIAFSVMLSILAYKYVWTNVVRLNVMSIGIKVPMAWFWMAIPIGNTIISIRLVIAFIEDHIIHRKLIKDEGSETNEAEVKEV